MSNTKVYCVICCKIYKTSQKYSPKYHHYVCNSCLDNTTIFSQTECKKRFLLKNNDLKGIKYIYSKYDHSKYYLLFQIVNILKKKYQSLQSFGKYLIKNKIKYVNKLNNLREKQNKRLQEIKENLIDYRLPFHFDGNIYLYVIYGKPKLEKVLKLEIKKQDKINQRIEKLNRYLEKYDLEYDENIVACYNYVYNIGIRKSIRDIIRDIEIESFYKKNTNYLTYCETYSDKVAKELSLKEYMKDNKKPEYIKSEFKVYFD